MTFWKKQKEIITCKCGESLELKREKLPFWWDIINFRSYDSKKRVGNCPDCEIHYERSPSGHLHLSYGRKYDDFRCADDYGHLERVVHIYNNLFGQERFEFIMYCPRHEQDPSTFLEGISSLDESNETFGFGNPEKFIADFTALMMGIKSSKYEQGSKPEDAQ